jgi:hypothetical protein
MAHDTGDLFFRSGALDRQRAESLLAEALTGADDGELFLEFRQSEALVFDDGRLRIGELRHQPGLRACAPSPAKRRPMPIRAR